MQLSRSLTRRLVAWRLALFNTKPSVMNKFSSLLLLGFVMLLASPPVFASYRDGAWGVFILFFSAGIAVAALIITILFLFLGWFKNKLVFAAYCAVYVVSAVFAVILSGSADDPLSIKIVLIGEPILLIPVLLPAYIQLHRARRLSAPQQGAPADAQKNHGRFQALAVSLNRFMDKNNKSFMNYYLMRNYLIYSVILSALILPLAGKHGAHFGWGFLVGIILMIFMTITGILFIVDFFVRLILSSLAKGSNQVDTGMYLVVDFVVAFGIYLYLEWMLGW